MGILLCLTGLGVSLSEVGVAAGGKGMGQRHDGIVGSRGVLANLAPHVCQSARLRWGSLALHASLMETPVLCTNAATVQASCFPKWLRGEKACCAQPHVSPLAPQPFKVLIICLEIHSISGAEPSLSCGWQSGARLPAAPRVPGAAGSSPPAAWRWVEPHRPVTKGRDRGRRVSAPSCALPWELPSLCLT